MTKFIGKTNLVLGDGSIASVADPLSRNYVIEVSGKDVAKFRSVADMYGYVEDVAESVEVDVAGDDQDA